MEHLLVQLVTWLFETLFGSQEKPANVGPRENSDDERSPKRGPYNYGDKGRPSTQGKSLAELLEEVRQQNSGGGARIEVATPPPERLPPQQAKIVIQPEEVQQQQPKMKDSITTIHMRGLGPAQAQILPPPPVPADPPKKKKKKRQQEQQEHPLHLAHQPTRMTMPRAQAVSFKSRHTGLGTGVNPAAIMWMDSIKAGSAEQRRLVQTQAVMAMEVFGPPRCRKPHRPGV